MNLDTQWLPGGFEPPDPDFAIQARRPGPLHKGAWRATFSQVLDCERISEPCAIGKAYRPLVMNKRCDLLYARRCNLSRV